MHPCLFVCPPVQLKMIDFSLMTPEEVRWMDDYHSRVWTKVGNPRGDGWGGLGMEVYDKEEAMLEKMISRPIGSMRGPTRDTIFYKIDVIML